MSDALTRREIDDAISQIFMQNHGVGDRPVDPSELSIAELVQINKDSPSQRETQFAREVFKGVAPTVAYGNVFDPDDELTNIQKGQLARHLSRRPRVAKLIYSLRQKSMNMLEEDLPKLIGELNEDRDLARKHGQAAAAISAVKAKADMLGLNQPKEVNVNHTFDDLDDSTMRVILDRAQAKLGTPEIELPDVRRDVVDAEYEEIE